MAGTKQGLALEAKLEQRNAELAFLADGIALDAPWKRERASDTAYWPKFRNAPVFSTVMLPGVPDAPIRGLNISSYPPLPKTQPPPPAVKPPPKQDAWPSMEMLQDAARENAAAMSAQREQRKRAPHMSLNTPLPAPDMSMMSMMMILQQQQSQNQPRPRPPLQMPAQEQIAPEPMAPKAPAMHRAPRRPTRGAMTPPISVVDSFHQGDADRLSDLGQSPELDGPLHRAREDPAVRYLRNCLPRLRSEDRREEPFDDVSAIADPPVISPRVFRDDAEAEPLFEAQPLHQMPAYAREAPLIDDDPPAYEDEIPLFAGDQTLS